MVLTVEETIQKRLEEAQKIVRVNPEKKAMRLKQKHWYEALLRVLPQSVKQKLLLPSQYHFGVMGSDTLGNILAEADVDSDDFIVSGAHGGPIEIDESKLDPIVAKISAIEEINPQDLIYKTRDDIGKV